MTIPIGAEEASRLERADIVVDGLEQAGPSCELRVFVNNPDADAGTEPTPDAGYAGSIYVYGYGQPPDPESGGRPRIPMTRYVMATDAVRTAAANGPTAAVTLVPVSFTASDPDINLDDLDVSVLVHS
ncbi:MAG: hypothetical protein M3071_23050 [Actinomycetota bacterium]|nr:hypothetical protein [Actinomycetota bacterium]